MVHATYNPFRPILHFKKKKALRTINFWFVTQTSDVTSEGSVIYWTGLHCCCDYLSYKISKQGEISHRANGSKVSGRGITLIIYPLKKKKALFNKNWMTKYGNSPVIQQHTFWHTSNEKMSRKWFKKQIFWQIINLHFVFSSQSMDFAKLALVLFLHE